MLEGGSWFFMGYVFMGFFVGLFLGSNMDWFCPFKAWFAWWPNKTQPTNVNFVFYFATNNCNFYASLNFFNEKCNYYIGCKTWQSLTNADGESAQKDN